MSILSYVLCGWYYIFTVFLGSPVSVDSLVILKTNEAGLKRLRNQLNVVDLNRRFFPDYRIRNVEVSRYLVDYPVSERLFS